MIVSKCKPEDVTLSTHDLYRLGSRSDILCLQDRSLAAFSLWRRCWRAGSWSTRSWCSWCCQLLLMAIQDACGCMSTSLEGWTRTWISCSTFQGCTHPNSLGQCNSARQPFLLDQCGAHDPLVVSFAQGPSRAPQKPRYAQQLELVLESRLLCSIKPLAHLGSGTSQPVQDVVVEVSFHQCKWIGSQGSSVCLPRRPTKCDDAQKTQTWSRYPANVQHSHPLPPSSLLP